MIQRRPKGLNELRWVFFTGPCSCEAFMKHFPQAVAGVRFCGARRGGFHLSLPRGMLGKWLNHSHKGSCVWLHRRHTAQVSGAPCMSMSAGIAPPWGCWVHHSHPRSSGPGVFSVKHLVISQHRVLGGSNTCTLLVSTGHRVLVTRVAVLCDQMPRGKGMVFVLGQAYVLV